jgi:hypothetical protein
MALSRRFFSNLAERYNRLRPAPDTPEYELWTLMVAATVTVIEGERASFDRDRFFDAAAGVKRSRTPARN